MDNEPDPAVYLMSAVESKLRSRVEEKLNSNDRLQASQIGVVVRDGIVLLWGSAESDEERGLAGELAALVADRTGIINHVQVVRPNHT